ncbi:hypothetical protein KCU90_g1002, partial [Aureobasidium melanogenum]
MRAIGTKMHGVRRDAPHHALPNGNLLVAVSRCDCQTIADLDPTRGGHRTLADIVQAQQFGDPHRSRLFEYRGNGTRLQHPALFDHQHFVGEESRLVGIVRDDDGHRGYLALQGSQRLLQTPPPRRIERRERLVEQQQFAMTRERPGQRHTLPLTERQLMRQARDQLRETQVFEPVTRAGGIGVDRKRELLRDRHVRKQTVVLRHITDLAALGRQRAQIGGAEPDGTGCVGFEPRNQAQCQRFAGARRSDDREPSCRGRPRDVEFERAQAALQMKGETPAGGLAPAGGEIRAGFRRVVAVFGLFERGFLPNAIDRQRRANNRNGERWQQQGHHRRQTLAAEYYVRIHRQRVRVIGHHHRCAEFAERTQPRERESCTNRRPRDRQHHAEKTAARMVTERGGHVVEHRVHGGKRRFRGDDQEGRGHEDFREHDAGKRIRQRPVGELADPAIRAEQKQQQHAARERRQGERQLYDEAEQRHLARVRPCQQIAERHAAEQNHERGHTGARRRDADRRPHRAPVDMRPVGRAELRHARDKRRA